MSGNEDTCVEDFVVEGGTLFVNREVLHNSDLMFEKACAKLLEADTSELLLDLSKSTYISSTYVGIVAAAFFQSNYLGKTLRLRTNSSLTKVLKMAGFEEFMSIEEVA